MWPERSSSSDRLIAARERSLGEPMAIVRSCARRRISTPSTSSPSPARAKPERHQRPHGSVISAPVASRLRDRLLRHRDRRPEVAEQHLLTGRASSSSRARSTLGSAGSSATGALERGEALLARRRPAQVLAEPLVQRGGAQRLGARSSTSSSASRISATAREVSPRASAQSAASAQHLGAVHAGALLGVRHARPQLERALELALRLLVGVDRAWPPARRARSRRARGSARARRASGTRARRPRSPARRRRRAARPRVERRGDPARAAPCPRRAAGRRARPRRRARGGTRSGRRASITSTWWATASRAPSITSAGGELGDRLEQRVRASGGPARRRRAIDRLRGAVESRSIAREQHVAQVLGQQPLLAVPAGRQQLLGVERVALRAGEQPLGEVARRRRLQDARELLGDLAAVEALERDPLDARPRAPARPAAGAADGAGAARRSGR